MEALHSRRTYDYRIQEAICESGDRELFPELNIPRSTIRNWIHRGARDVVTGDLAAHDRVELAAEIERFRRRTALLGAVVGLLIVMLRVSNVWLDCERLPEGDPKRILLRAIKRAGKVLPLNTALRIAHLSASRHHAWRRTEAGCDLGDQSSCPRPKPKIGIRAKAPGELLHLDVTIIRLLDGTRAYLHAAIDTGPDGRMVPTRT
jgi:hypothetical protein